ncbi:MAG: BamA/TamA family outer membrane protein, partial [Myxococcaceae bacterium]
GGQDRGFLDLFGWQANLSFIEPRLVNLIPGIGPEVLKRIGLRGDIIFENVARPSYRFTRFSTVAGFDFPLLKNLSASLQAEFEIDDVFKVATVSGGQRVDAIDQQRLRFPEGRFVLMTARVPIALDLRDDPLNPRVGWLFSISPELIGDVGGQNINLWRLAGAITRYQPLVGDWGLALSIRSGVIIPRDPEARSIGPKRFFLGGSNSMRGFREDGLIPEDRRVTLRRDITSCRTLLQPQGCTAEAARLRGGEDILSEGGDVFVLGRSELRVPLFGAWGLTGFFELGNLWLDQSQFNPAVLRRVAGGGLRYMTPVGPATLDIGFNLARDVVVGEPQYNVNFSLGAF